MPDFVVCYYEFMTAPNGEETRPVTVICIEADDMEAAKKKAVDMITLVEEQEGCDGPEHEVFTIAEWISILKSKAQTLLDDADDEDDEDEVDGGEDTGHSQ